MIPNILSLLVFLPLAGAIVLLLIPRENKNVIRSMAVGTSLLALVLSVAVWSAFDRTVSGMQMGESYPWIDFGIVQIDYALGIDGLSLPLLLLTTIISTVAIVASFTIRERVKEYYVWTLVLITGMLGVFAALDLFLFFLFFELTLIPMFFIIGIWGGKKRSYASFKFLLYTGLGSAVMFMAFIALAFKGADAMNLASATFNMVGLAEAFSNPSNSEAISSTFKAGLFLALLVGFAVKLPIFPLHTWLPDAYAEAPIPATMILAGVLSKLGAYGILRVGYGILPDQAVSFATLIAILGVINIIYGASLALVQTDLRKLIAYASISHMGIILLGAASFTQAGVQGAIFQMVSHGLITALLFFMAGALYVRTKTYTLSELGGLAKSVPVLTGFMLAAALASLGLPGMSGFVSELLAFMGIFGASPDVIPQATVIAVIGALGIILTAAYLLWAVQRTAFGQMDDKYRGLHDARPLEYVPMIGLLGASILIGVFPHLLSDVINSTVIEFVSRIGG
ncbi:complex I subunit 4 family protein [Alteribacter aurantiacus]|uniref:complex I subunit 4 family protein n=1 Tax=Alteribacter aurantiacus TaxID=254410 RepID=UPI00040F061F|nr:NADH-quinone oxidoreductase subunit M [Alteribacter aurantiacus]